VQCYGVAGLTCLTPCPIEGVATYPFIEKPGRTGPFDRLPINRRWSSSISSTSTLREFSHIRFFIIDLQGESP